MRHNKITRYTATVARILLALTFFVFGWIYFVTPLDKMPLDITTDAGKFMTEMISTGYFMAFVKIVEGVCGALLFFKRTTPIALLILAPVIINIFLFNTLLSPVMISGVIMGTIPLALEAFLIWYNWDKFAAIFKA